MAGIMSKIKTVGGVNPPEEPENNPIVNFFELGKENCYVGPGFVWKVYDALRKLDGRECSVFMFDKRNADKLFKPKRKDAMLDRIRWCICAMDKMNHPKMLEILHSLEEGNNTIAFAAEAVFCCLQNIFAWQESNIMPGGQTPLLPHPVSLGPAPAQASQTEQTHNPPPLSPHAREYHFLDIELRYGLLQLVEALHYLHYTSHKIHHNVCPSVIIVTKKGTWKLFGLEFYQDISCKKDPTDIVPVSPWSPKIPKAVQPNLDFMAPEVQMSGQCSILSDMFSLGLVICALFNNGKSLIQANNNPALYLKQVEFLTQQVDAIMPKVPSALREAVQRLLTMDPHPRPTTHLLPLIKYFKSSSETAIAALQFLDVLAIKGKEQKANFCRGQLIEALPYIPKKLRWQHVWRSLKLEIKTTDALAAVLQPVFWLTNDANPEEFACYALPTLVQVMRGPKTVQAAVAILENLHIIVKKCQPAEIHNDVLPSLYNALECNNNPMQVAGLIALQNIADYIEDQALHTTVLEKVRLLLESHQTDVKIISLTLGFFEKNLHRLERIHILEKVIPTLLAIRLNNPDIVTRVVKLYKAMLMERKFALTTNMMATKMIPSLAPQTVNPALNVDQFTNLMEVLYDMLGNIEQNQRHKLKLESITQTQQSPERRRLRHQISTDNMNAPPFNIPNLRVDRRKTSSAEDMARKNSISGPPPTGSVGGFKSTGIGQFIFGSNNSTNNDNNFLRVANVFPNRRLSDNTLMTPKIRIAPSCASSPGGTPGGAAGLPARRHSSIGPQERRTSHVNLSPPTGYRYRGRSAGSGSSLSVPTTSHCVGGSMPNTSSSVPFLLTSSMHSIRSRRPSAAMSGSHGSGLLQQLSSGVVRHLPSGSSGAHHSQLAAPWNALQGATAAGYNALQHTAMAVRKCPSLNITLTR